MMRLSQQSTCALGASTSNTAAQGVIQTLRRGAHSRASATAERQQLEKCNVKEGLLLLLFNINNNITLELLNNSRLTLGAANNNKR